MGVLVTGQTREPMHVQTALMPDGWVRIRWNAHRRTSPTCVPLEIVEVYLPPGEVLELMKQLREIAADQASLVACPFCGAEASPRLGLLSETDGTCMVECTACGATGPAAGSVADAAETWNILAGTWWNAHADEVMTFLADQKEKKRNEQAGSAGEDNAEPNR